MELVETDLVGRGGLERELEQVRVNGLSGEASSNRLYLVEIAELEVHAFESGLDAPLKLRCFVRQGERLSVAWKSPSNPRFRSLRLTERVRDRPRRGRP